MTQYVARVVIPGHVRQFFETMQGQGHIHFIPGNPEANYTFEADDLYDAAILVREVTQEVTANLPFHGDEFEIRKPTERWMDDGKTEILDSPKTANQRVADGDI